MSKILIQAGHKGRTSGATGAPEEQKWTSEIVPKIASKLRERGFEVKEIGADPSNNEIAGDWDLFLSVHYDADTYNDRGGFIDTPDPSTDFATKESNRIAEVMRKHYFSKTGIPNHPERSNRNTRFYYMWSKMSAKTPCVIIEAGVGFRTPEDHKTLWFSQDKVVAGIADGITEALGKDIPAPVDPCAEKNEEITRLKTDISNLKRDHAAEIKAIDESFTKEKNEAVSKALEEIDKKLRERLAEALKVGPGETLEDLIYMVKTLKDQSNNQNDQNSSVLEALLEQSGFEIVSYVIEKK